MLGQYRTAITAMVCVSMIGCQSASKQPSGEMSSLLRTVSYETPEIGPDESSANTTEWTGPSFTERARTFGTGVRDGVISASQFTGKLVTSAALQLLNPMNYFDRDDDDEPDTSTPRGRDEKEFDDWLERREDWRKENTN